jgi:iron-sulfur cluster repair protein YtfE (RIC family)
MRVLAPLGIDLCCGGGHPLGEALDLHGLDRPAVLAEVEQIVAQSTPAEG